MTLLQAIAELDEAALHRSLAHLQAGEFLYETRLFPEHAYTFKHALTHEVAYGSLLQEPGADCTPASSKPRPPLPRPPGRTGRAPGPPRPAGEVWDKALAYCRQAGEKAMAQSAHREAM